MASTPRSSQQSNAFLRPDSLVAVIDMTDEDDSEIDVRALGGQGYLWMATNFDPPRGTSGCDENAASSGLTDPDTCDSCKLATDAGTDPSCSLGDYSATNDWGYNPNLRHVHMTQKYGVLAAVPDPALRPRADLDEGPGSQRGVPGRRAQLPGPHEPATARTPSSPPACPTARARTRPRSATCPSGSDADLVYFAHIGGMPHQLLQQDPTQADSPPKETLTDADWTKIVGNDPPNFDYTGIDPHMIESYQPRTGLAAPPASTPRRP